MEIYAYYVEIYPDMNEVQLTNMMKEIEIAAKKRLEVNDLLDLKIERVGDIEGNLINEREYSENQQFREFFVQQVKPDMG